MSTGAELGALVALVPSGAFQLPVTVPVALTWVLTVGPPPVELMFPFACAPPQGPRICGPPANPAFPSAANPGCGTDPTIAATSALVPSAMSDRQRTRTRPFRSVAALAS